MESSTSSASESLDRLNDLVSSSAETVTGQGGRAGSVPGVPGSGDHFR